MRPTLDRSIVMGVSLIVALLGVGAAIIYRSIETFSQNAELLAAIHTDEELAASLLRTTSNAVNSQRAFLLTGREELLAPYHKAVQELPETLQLLRARTSENLTQQALLDSVEQDISALLSDLARGVALQRQGGDAAAQGLDMASTRPNLERIDERIAEVRREATEQLIAREIELKRAYRITLAVAVLSLVVALAVFVGLGELIRRHMASQEQNQQRLFAQHEQLAVTLASIGDAVIATDTEGRVSQLNRAAEQLTGWSADDARNRPLHEVALLKQEALGEPLQDLVPDVLKDGEIAGRVRDAVLVSRENDERSVRVSAAPIRSVKGDVTGVVIVVRDVTESKRAEQELAASQEFLRSSLDALTSHIAVLDEAGTIMAVNQVWRVFSDSEALLAPAYSIGDNYLKAGLPFEGVAEGDAEKLLQGTRDVIAGKIPAFIGEYASRTPEAQRWYQMRVTRFSGVGPIRVIVAHEDVTARVRSEEATRRWSEQQHGLAELATQLSAAQDVDETMQLVTAGACRLVESLEVETIYSSRDDWTRARRTVSLHTDRVEAEWLLAPVAEGDPIRNHVRRTNRPLRIASTEWVAHPLYSAQLKGGCAPQGGCLAAPLSDREGRNIGLIQLCGRCTGEFTDDDEAVLVQLAQMASVSLERTRLYEEIRAADQRKDQFLAMLAHELRNPLSALISGTQLITLNPSDEAQVTEVAQLILRQCEQLKQLVDDLLDVSRISRGKLNLQIQAVRMQEVLQTAFDIARPSIDAGRHQFESLLTDIPLFVEGDPVRLAQIVANLLINAAKYTPEEGHIHLSLDAEEGDAVIRVRDDGIGIPRDELDGIFELFAQVDGSNTRAQGGLGIGLTLVRTLARLHGGTVAVASPGENQGSTFIVRLPLAAEVAEESLKSDEESLPGDLPGCRILVVDDNRAGLHVLTRLLTSIDQRVQSASDGRTALSIIPDFRPQIVISDIAMPDMSGYELATAIRRMTQLPQPLLVALTGFGQPTDKEAALQAGFDHHLVKPVSLDQLTELLTSFATRRQRH